MTSCPEKWASQENDFPKSSSEMRCAENKKPSFQIINPGQ